MSSVLYSNGSIYSPADPAAQSMLVTNGLVEWVSSESSPEVQEGTQVVDLSGAFVAPGFVDSHTHAVEVGRETSEVNCADLRSAKELLERIALASRELPEGQILRGRGWDETRWELEALPTVAQIERAVGGREVFLSRVDGHSAIVSRSLIRASGHEIFLEGDDDAVLRGEQKRQVALYALLLSEEESLRAARAGLDLFAASGHVAIVENAAPQIGGLTDVVSLKKASLLAPSPQVFALWGEAVPDAQKARDVVDQIQQSLLEALGDSSAPSWESWILGLGGDLNIDGSVGSHTASMRERYVDSDTQGFTYLSAQEVGRHLIACTRATLQGGFHVIGDRGMDIALEGARLARDEVGARAFAARGHRLEHAEMTDDDALASLRQMALTLSVQPGFQGAWGHAGGMYERRLGRERTMSMNRIATMHREGIPVAFGSDAPVLPPDPWGQIFDAMSHPNSAERISARAAFTAHTRGGWRALNSLTGEGLRHGQGQLIPGAPASFAVWEIEQLAIQTPDERLSAWSTDPRARVPMLPALDTAQRPRALRTVLGGNTIFDSGELA